jgi:hypothetical protein
MLPWPSEAWVNETWILKTLPWPSEALVNETFQFSTLYTLKNIP